MLNRDQKLESLRRCPLFAGLDPAALAVLAEAVEEETFTADEEVCKAGETADSVYVIHSGSLAVFRPGAEKPVRMMSPGEVFGEYGMVTGFRTTTIRAVETTTMLSMDYSRFRTFLNRWPEALFELLSVAVNRLTEAEAGLKK